MKMTVTVGDYTSWDGGPPRKVTTEVTVTLERLTHIGTYELPEDDRRFAVILPNLGRVGYIERSVQSTDRHYGRIRVPGKGRPAWQWHRDTDNGRSSPGVHEPNRAHAIAHVLGYDWGEVKK